MWNDMTEQNSVTRRTILSGAVGLTTAAMFPSSLVLAQSANRIVLRTSKEMQNIDPPFRAGVADGNVIHSVFQTLITYERGSFKHVLDAASRVDQVSPTEIGFTLKPGQMFSDGYGEMTTDDVKFSFERYLRPDADGKISSYKDDWTNLVEVKVHDKYSGSLIFSKPSPAVWDVALVGSSGAIQSRKAVAALGAKYSQTPVGSGPYKVASFEPQRGLTLVTHTDYAGEKPAFETCELRYIANAKTAELALRAKEIDFTELSVAAANDMAGLPDLTITKQPSLRFIWMGMNMQRGSLANLAVRQAIRAAIDVDQMILAGYQGDAPRLNAMIPPGILGHWADAPVYSRDVDKAKTLLAQSGVALPLTLKLTILNEPSFQNMALVAQALLQEVGINVEIDQRETGTYWSSGKGTSGEALELFLLRFNAVVDPNFNTRWFLPDQIGDWNWQRFNDAQYVKLQEESSVNTDPASRGAQIIEMQKLMDASASMIWLTNDVFAFGVRKGLSPAVLPNGNDWQLRYFRPA
jgi:peptide/nickel transport system substrate-binding protein